MAEDIEISFNIEDLSQDVLDNVERAVERSLYAAGITVQKGATDSISGLYTEENRAVKTGRLRASISFITSSQQSGGEKNKPENAKETDALRGIAEPHTMIFGSNVEYAAAVHNGMWTSEAGGKNKKYKVRPFLREGLDRSRDEIRDLIERIFKGEL